MTDHDPQPTMEERRAALVAELRAKGVPLPPPIEHAFLTVPRHLFVPGVYLDAVYRDQVIVTKRDKEGQAVSSSSQPAIMAVMLDALDVRAGHRVLEIGTGTGYNAALLAEIVGEAGQVTTIELDDEIAEAAKAHLERAGYPTIAVITGDGAHGYAPAAPYDRIMVTASAWDLPAAWREQLRAGGVLVVPLRFEGVQIGAALVKQADGSLRSSRLFPLGFVPLQGAAAPPTAQVQVPASALRLTFGDNETIDEAAVYALLADQHEWAQLPLELSRCNLGLLCYYLLFHEPETYQFVTYQVDDGQTAFGLQGIGWGILSRTSACLVPFGDERVVHLYGGSDAYLTLVTIATAWQEAGQPDLESGLLRPHLHIAPAGRQPFQPPAGSVDAIRVFQRPTHTFTLWLERE